MLHGVPRCRRQPPQAIAKKPAGCWPPAVPPHRRGLIATGATAGRSGPVAIAIASQAPSTTMALPLPSLPASLRTRKIAGRRRWPGRSPPAAVPSQTRPTSRPAAGTWVGAGPPAAGGCRPGRPIAGKPAFSARRASSAAWLRCCPCQAARPAINGTDSGGGQPGQAAFGHGRARRQRVECDPTGPVPAGGRALSSRRPPSTNASCGPRSTRRRRRSEGVQQPRFMAAPSPLLAGRR